LKIYTFTAPELDYLRSKCNFTKEERYLFEQRSLNYTIEETAEKMNVSISTAKRISRRVNEKVVRIKNNKNDTFLNL